MYDMLCVDDWIELSGPVALPTKNLQGGLHEDP